MSQHDYTIKKALLIVLGLDAFLLFCLLLIALLLEGDAMERLVFTLFFLPTLLLFLECYFRRVTVAKAGMAIRKLGRTKAFPWGEITRVGCLTVRRKVYLLLTTVKGLFIISNAFEGFSKLVEEIVARVEPERVEEDVRPQAASAKAGIATIFPAWVAAVFMMVMILMKWFPFIA
ncbi:MAG: hypothetical protein C0390_04430 [Syntrophus sp. (in: bacteria)]|nr:hypothetical protein [Syntrophus sp. (in: bacteria)]